MSEVIAAVTDTVKAEIQAACDKVEHFERFLTHDIPETGVHTYFHKSYCTDRTFADSVIGACEYLSPVYIGTSLTDVPYTQFLDDIFYHEDNLNVFTRKGLKKHYIEFVSLLIPRKMPDNEIIDFAEYMADKMMDGVICTWFYGTRHQDGIRFVDLFFSEREYFPKGTEIFEYYKSNRYMDADTHQCCKPDNPNAIILNRKGDVKRKYTAKFGLKAMVFRQTDAAFKRWRRIMQRHIITYVRNYEYEDRTFLLPRADYTKCPNKYIVYIAHEFNKIMIRLEEKTNEVRNRMEENDISYNYNEFRRILRTVKAILYKGTGKVKYNNHVYNVNVSIAQNYRPFVASMDLLERKYDEMLLRINQMAYASQMRC